MNKKLDSGGIAQSVEPTTVYRVVASSNLVFLVLLTYSLKEPVNKNKNLSIKESMLHNLF